MIKEDDADVMGFADGSGYKGGVGMAAVIYVDGEEVGGLRYQLGTEDDHEVYEVECIGLVLALHLTKKHQRGSVRKLLIWIDNTVVIMAMDTATSGPLHYILNYFHGLLAQVRARHLGVRVVISWVPGHMGFEGNKCADKQAKKVAEGHSSS